MIKKIKQEGRWRRHKRIRAKIFGTARQPRLSVFKSARHIYAQLIDDKKGYILVSANDLELERQSKRKTKRSGETRRKGRQKNVKILSGKIFIAEQVGKLIAEKALKKKIDKVVFDRGGYKYHGRVKALAEGAREGGLKF
jgi:large subunit ribosomal protein L18